MTEPAADPWSAERGRSFGGVADVYAASRPEYPAEALTWVAGPRCRQVLDLGAGTGKLSSGLVTAGWQVTAVEPLLEMLDRFAAPEAHPVAGTAESIPLADQSMDAVFAGQAFHWFRTDEALAEIARVLRPAGRLGLLWNMIDLSEPWAADLAAIMHEQVPALATVGTGKPFDSKLFSGLQWRQFAHGGQRMDLPSLLDLVRSRSYIVTLPAEEHAAVLDQVTRLVREHPDLRGRAEFTLPYVTDTWRATKC
ncbi:MAG: class I SAM-dependent methyltransferase [Mycobacteriales bacterium]